MIADPLEILGDEQQMRGRGDVVRAFHHEGEQGAEDGVVEIVHRLVALADLLGLGGVAGDEGVERASDHLGDDPAHFGQERKRPQIGTVLDRRDPFGDVLGIIADPLDHADDLQGGDDLAQIVRHRRPQGDDLHRQPLDLGLEGVDPLVLLDDKAGGLAVALDERAQRGRDRRLRQAAHFGDAGAESVEIVVEGFESVT